MNPPAISDEYCFMSTILWGFLLLTAIFTFTFLSSKKRSNSRCPVAPTSAIENMRCLGGNNCPFFALDTMRALKSDIYKLKMLSVTSGDWYVVGDAQAARDILLDRTTEKPPHTSFDHFSGGPTMFSVPTKDPRWHHVRKGTAPAFSSSEVRRMNDICQSCLDTWIEERLETLIDSDETFDPSKEMTHLTFKVILESAFEYKNASRQEFETYHSNLETSFREFSFENPFRVWFGLFIPGRRRAFKAARDIQVFCAKILDHYRNNPNKSGNNTVIRLIENNNYLSENGKIAEMTIFLLGGHDTTGYQLASTLVLLAKHPQEAEKLKNDLLSAETTNEGKRPRTGSRYLKFVIQESSRVMPVSSTGSIRITGKDFTFKNGSVVIPKNSITWFPFLLQNRNDKYFEDPDEFKPGRWEDATKEMTQALIPFSLGTRNCIGQRLANAELNCCLAILMSKYSFELVEEGEIDYFLTLKFRGARLRATRI